MKDVFLKNEEFLAQMAGDVEVLMNENLQALKGGAAMRACSCCCMENNGGGQSTKEDAQQG